MEDPISLFFIFDPLHLQKRLHRLYSYASSSPARSISPMPSPPHQTFSSYMMEENVIYAEQIITKWNLDSSTYTKIDYLFTGDRRQAREFVKAVKALRTAMHFFVSEKSSSDILIHAQKLMQMAMKRLEKEFYQILSSKRDSLNPESVSSRSSSRARSSLSDHDDGSSDEEDLSLASSSSEMEMASEMAMADLKAIADCMVSSGYGKECIKWVCVEDEVG